MRYKIDVILQNNRYTERIKVDTDDAVTVNQKVNEVVNEIVEQVKAKIGHEPILQMLNVIEI